VLTEHASARRRRVLVADDDEAMRTTLVFTLLDDGYDVEEVASGDEVVQRLASSGSRDSGFDLVVMDIRMPGLSGLDAVRRLRALERTTPVVLMTAFASPETMAEAHELHVPLLSKPFALSAFTKLARDCMVDGDR
jgi:CheY-like chemotaxis protein